MEKLPPGLEKQLRRLAGDRKAPLFELIFSYASSFHEAAIRSMEVRPAGDGRSSFPMVPATVNKAFACELYLKALHAIETGRARQGHRLSVLFAGLPPETQKRVRTRYDKRREGAGCNLERDLSSFSNAFTEWRYVYEMRAGMLDAVGLAQLAASLYETCVELKPELKGDPYTHGRLTAAAQGIPIFAMLA